MASGTVKKQKRSSNRLRLPSAPARLSGEWATVGTGWQAWPDLAKESGLTLSSGEVELPAAEDMLPLAIQLLAAGKKPWPLSMRNPFICETKWRGRNFTAASESQ